MIIPDALQLQNSISRLKQILNRTILDRLEDYQYRVNQNRRLLGDMDFLLPMLLYDWTTLLFGWLLVLKNPLVIARQSVRNFL